MLKTISGAELVPIDLFEDNFPVRVNLAYSRDEAPNIFGVVYRRDARLWLHKSLAAVVLLAARLVHAQHGYTVVVYDGLRSCEAQEKMRTSPIVQKNPQWLEEPNRLLSPPGKGGHPRAMAVDVSLRDDYGYELDMGTAFDHLAEQPDAPHNPAHRDHPHISETARHNRDILTGFMLEAARLLDVRLLPLPQEWWDFRLPADVYEAYAPLSDSELPPQIRMTDDAGETTAPDLPPEHFSALKDEMEALVAAALDRAYPST